MAESRLECLGGDLFCRGWSAVGISRASMRGHSLILTSYKTVKVKIC